MNRHNAITAVCIVSGVVMGTTIFNVIAPDSPKKAYTDAVMPGGQRLACYPKDDYLVCIPSEVREP